MTQITPPRQEERGAEDEVACRERPFEPHGTPERSDRSALVAALGEAVSFVNGFQSALYWAALIGLRSTSRSSRSSADGGRSG